MRKTLKDIKQVSPYIRDNQVKFIFYRSSYNDIEEIKKVNVIGSFNGWDIEKSIKLIRRDSEIWSSDYYNINDSGTYFYRYIVNDGIETKDRDNFAKHHDLHENSSTFDIYLTNNNDEKLLNALLNNSIPQNILKLEKHKLLYQFDELLKYKAIKNSKKLETQYKHSLNNNINLFFDKTQHLDFSILFIYNSGYIIKYKNIYIGLDIVLGRTLFGIYWDINEDIYDLLSEKLDYLITSHLHQDHFDIYLCDKMVNKNKKVIIPEEYNNTNHSKIIVNQNKIIDFDIFTLYIHKGLHVYDNGRNIHLNYYEFELEDKTILFFGDHDYTTPTELYKNNFDYIFPKFSGITPLHSAVDCIKILNKYVDYDTIIPSHIIELSHPPFGGRGSYTQLIENEDIFKGNLIVPFWLEIIV